MQIDDARDRAPGIVDASCARRLAHGKGREASGASLDEGIGDFHPALRADADFPAPLFIERYRRLRGGRRMDAFFGREIVGHRRQISICEMMPPMRNAPIHVLNQITSASLNPRSFSMTMSDAMHGTNRVIVTSATTT